LREAIDLSVRPAVDAGGVDSDDGCVEFLLPFERLESAYADLVKLGGAVEARQPSELRGWLAQTGRELVVRLEGADLQAIAVGLTSVVSLRTTGFSSDRVRQGRRRSAGRCGSEG
jgi:hypothetical protein